MTDGNPESEGAETVWSASPSTLAFHRQALGFDSLSLAYVLEERYAAGLAEGGIDATIVTFFIEESWPDTLRLIETFLKRIEESPLLRLATTAAEIRRAKRDGMIAVIMGSQGSSCIGEDFSRLGTLVRFGLRSLQLAYTGANLYGDGCGERRNAGLTVLGEEFIDAVNEQPMLLDLSHCGHRTTDEAIARATNPVCTHANAFAVHPVDRNKTDETVKSLVRKGGMIGVCMPPRFVGPGAPDLGRLLDHVDHLCRLVGSENVGTGFDFTERMQVEKTDLAEARRWRRRRPDIFGTPEEFAARVNPRGLETVRDAPNFTQGLRDRGYDETAVAGIIGENWMRVFARVAG